MALLLSNPLRPLGLKSSFPFCLSAKMPFSAFTGYSHSVTCPFYNMVDSPSQSMAELLLLLQLLTSPT
jgi:hypothetical protein